MRIIKVCGATRSSKTTVNIEWNSGKTGLLTIDSKLNIFSFGKRLPVDIEKRVKSFLLKACPEWIIKEIERLEVEKSKSLKGFTSNKSSLYRANYKKDDFKISALENSLNLFVNLGGR